MEREFTIDMLVEYKKHLTLAEKSAGTIEKYIRDLRVFYHFLPADKRICKEVVIQYKESVILKHAVSTANGVVAALNSFFDFMDWVDCKVKPFKRQRQIFRDKERELTKEEYLRLLKTAKQMKNERLFYVMETLCATGIRISELQFITVEAAKNGKAQVNSKGKLRAVLLPPKLRQALLNYCQKHQIQTGRIFITKQGTAVSRCNVW